MKWFADVAFSESHDTGVSRRHVDCAAKCSDSQPSELHKQTSALLSEQRDALLQDVVAAHPAMSDPRQPLLTQQLAALPPAAHAAACRHHVRCNKGVAQVSMLDAPALLQALNALHNAFELTELFVARHPPGKRGGDLPERERAQAARLTVAAPALAALTRLTRVSFFSLHVSAAVAGVRALAALPSLAGLSFEFVDFCSQSGDGSGSESDNEKVLYLGLGAELGEALAACAALTRLDLYTCNNTCEPAGDGRGGVRSVYDCLLPPLARVPRLAALSELRLRGDRVGAYMAQLARIPRLAHLAIREAHQDIDVITQHLEDLTALESCAGASNADRARRRARSRGSAHGPDARTPPPPGHS
jgi:hypothetical protein